MNSRSWLPILCAWIAVCQTALSQLDEPQSLFVEGYTGRVSYKPGDEITLHVSTSASSYSIEVSRLGASSVTMTNITGIRGGLHRTPENASSHGCAWPVSHRFAIPADWRSGYYHITLRAADSGGRYIQRGRRTAESTCFFILRPTLPGSRTRILLQLSSNTYNAYNNYGGFCVYSFNAHAGVQGHRVSFERPPSSQFPSWEQPFVQWAEAKGYELDYCANADLESLPDFLDPYRLVLSVGHDEYWSAGMRDRLESFIGKGGNVAFLSGNTCCWQIRSEDEGRAFTCWKQGYNLDPVFITPDHSLLSTLWSHHLLKRPENTLTGVGFLWGGYHLSHGQFMDGKGSYTVHRPSHWIFEGTGLARGNEFGSKDTIVGYECDGCEFTLQDGLPVPTGSDGTPRNFQILASCPAKWHPDDAYWYERFEKGRVGAAVLGVYERVGTVFTTGSTDWSHGLRGKDPVVERITRNLLDKLGGQSGQ